jgi:hypothetical protein
MEKNKQQGRLQNIVEPHPAEMRLPHLATLDLFYLEIELPRPE